MKIPLLLLPLPLTAAFSALSSFTGVRSRTRVRPRAAKPTSFLSMYDASRDPPSSDQHNAWQVLANTEKWISSTLNSMGAGKAGENPYTRKEVSYQCENSKEFFVILANVFRRLKEVREMGERHGQNEERRKESMGDAYEPSTLRQTQVIVIPANKVFSKDFRIFDELVEAINSARRNARDYVTDVALEKLDDRLYGDEEDRDWSVSVNCAHTHPKFGELTPEQQLEQMKQEEKAGEVDVNYEEYMEKKMMARRSPYPTLIMEVRAIPPPDFHVPLPPSVKEQQEKEGVTSEDVQRLEALFSRSAHMDHPTTKTQKQSEDAFFDAIEQAFGEEETFTSVTPLVQAQLWLSENDPDCPGTATLTESDTPYVDAAYEFVFTNLAMLQESADASSGKTMRQYLVMPHFLSTSATSFEKFASEVRNMINVLPGLREKVAVDTFHPEHVVATRRSPSPVFVLEWKK